jgi:hypothetical protein
MSNASPPLPTGRQALPKGGTISLFGKGGIGEIFRRYVFSIMDSLVSHELLSHLITQ